MRIIKRGRPRLRSAYGLDKPKNGTIAVYDLAGGTFASAIWTKHRRKACSKVKSNQWRPTS